MSWVCALYGLVGPCQFFGGTCCYDLQGYSDNAGKHRTSIAFEDRRLREREQVREKEYGKGCGPVRSLQAGYRGGAG